MPRQYTRDGLAYARSALHLTIPTWEALCSAVEHGDATRAERQVDELVTWLTVLRIHLRRAVREAKGAPNAPGGPAAGPSDGVAAPSEAGPPVAHKGGVMPAADGGGAEP